MSRQVNCIKLGKEAEGLDQAPFPGEKGRYIYENVSKQAWQEWLGVQTVLINEHRLIAFEPQAKQLLERERNNFLFGDGVKLPDAFVAPKQ